MALPILQKTMRYALPFLLLLICFRLEAQLIPSSFRSPVTFAIPDQSSNDERDRLEVADLDGDDMMDIIATDISRGDMYIYRNAYTSGTLTNSSFDPRLDFEFWPSVLGVSGTAVADIDGDGKTDILFSNSTTPCNTNGFGVVRNNATPGSLSALDFEAPVFFQTGGCQSDITVADVDGDGKMDAIVVAPFSVFVLRNTSTPGNISFAAPVSSATRMEGRARLHMADVDTDGKPDILVGYSTDLGNDEISVFLNTSNVGAVSLAARQDFFIGTAARPWHIKSHDFDGDTKEEIIVATQFGGLAVLKNTSTPGTINLAIQAGFEDIGELSAPLSDVRLADFDQDGFIDIAGSEPSRAHVGVVRTISTTIDSAMFDTPVTFGAPNGTTGGFADTKVADFNGDGLPDIVSMRRNQVAVYENQFRRPPIISSISAYEGAVGDVITIRGSGFDPTHTNNIVLFGQVKAQTVSSTGSTIDVEVPLGAALDEVSVSTDGLTTISSRKFVPLFDGGTIDASSFAGAEVFSTTGFFRNTLELSDLDLDGKPDITISTGNIEFFKNTSTPGTIDQNTLTTQPTIFLGVSSVNTIGLGDLTGDGKADIFRNGSSSPGLFQNLSSGIDPTPFSFGGSIPSGTNGVVLGLPAGDLNLDGKVDLMFVSGSVALVQNFQRADTLGTQNIPDFAISPNAVTLLSPITLTLGGSFATDLDGDGKTDVGVISQSENLIRIFRNTLDPGQRTGWLEKFVGFDLPADGSSIAIETIDLDGDGDQEIASTSMATDQISIYPNQSNAGTLSFGTKFTLSTLADPTQIESADLNGDGLPELVVVYNTVQQISVFPNLGTLPLSSASFGTRIDYTLPGAARDLDIGDIDLDGKPDIVIGLLNQSNIAILKNQTSTAVRITIDQQPVAQSACTGEDAIFSIQASGTTNLLYQWQVDDGSGFVNLTDNAIYSGTQTNELTVTNVTLSLDDNLYRCVVTGDNAVAVNTNSAILNVNTVATPTITANGPLTFCEGGSVMLSGPAGFAQYLWSTGATTQNITVSTTQSVMLQVGDGRCLSASSPAVQVTVNDVPDQPTITVNGDTEICEGDQTQLSGPSGFDIYQWSNGATTQNITITSTATLTLVVGNQGCLSPASAPVAITVNAIPATPEIRASGPIGFCQGESVTLSGPNGFSTYQWSNGETTQNITVSSTFTVTLIVGNAGCLSAPSDAVNVTVSEIPQQPQITVNGETTICEGEQTVLSGPGGFDVYQWSNGETTQNVTITASQTLTLVVRKVQSIL